MLCISNLKCFRSLDMNQIELNHQMLCLFFVAGEYFVNEIQSEMDLQLFMCVCMNLLVL